MASLIQESGKSKNSYRLMFFDSNKKRQTMRFQANKSQALEIKLNVERIVLAKRHNDTLDAKTQAWVNRLTGEFAAKFAHHGLIEVREANQLQAFADWYLRSRQDLKPSSVKNWHNTIKAMVGFFGQQKDLRMINVGDCDEWRQHLVNSGRAQATISKMIKQARQLLKSAHRRGVVDANPFADIKAGTQRNDARLHFVDREVIDKLLTCVPDPEWTLIILLCRYGGLRCPSEVLTLRWTDIDWARGRILVQSPKGEKHGKGVRPMPIFPELREPLRVAQANAATETVYVVNRYRDSNNANLRTQFTRILKQAGIAKWPRLFHNLRASRETELADQFPIQVVTAWLGNSPQVAANHYLQTTDEHFERALSKDTRLK